VAVQDCLCAGKESDESVGVDEVADPATTAGQDLPVELGQGG